MKWPWIWIVILGAAGSLVFGQSFEFSPDVPTDIGGGTWLESDVVQQGGMTYGIAHSFPAGTPVDALHRMCSGFLLFSVESPTDLGGMTVEPGDVVEFDGFLAYTPFFCAGGVGIPPGTNVDAVFLLGDDSGDLVVSFDVPTDIAGVIYEPADLVQFARTGPGCSGWAVVGAFFDASAAAPPVPISTNVTGADVDGPDVVLAFDVPTTLGGATFLPGELVKWTTGGPVSYWRDPSWPISSRIDGFSLPTGPGTVPPTVTVKKAASPPGDLVLSWAVASGWSVNDYAIYEGTLGSWYSHTSKVCTDAGHDLTEQFTPASGNTYYIVVPLNDNAEGSYGTDSSGNLRPRGSSPCRATQDLDCP